MPAFSDIYRVFNYAEGVIWMGVAAALPLCFKMPTKNRKRGIGISSLGFFLFGITDLLETSLPSEVPVHLLIYKISCGAIILSGRFTYMGWQQFRLQDPFFLFGLFCLIAVSCIIGYQVS